MAGSKEVKGGSGDAGKRGKGGDRTAPPDRRGIAPASEVAKPVKELAGQLADAKKDQMASGDVSFDAVRDYLKLKRDSRDDPNN